MVVLQSSPAIRKKPAIIPKNPKMLASAIIIYLMTLSEEANSSTGSAKEARAVKATITTIIGLAIPADTAASPTIKPPTIPMVFPSGPGILIPASRRSSKENSINNVSIVTENGTVALVSYSDLSSGNGTKDG